MSTSNKTNLKKRTSGDAEQVFSVELDALYKHLNRRVKKENLAVVKGIKGTAKKIGIMI